MVENLPNESGTIDFDRWRRRIRDDTFGRYHFGMAQALLDHENNLEAGLAQLRRAVAVDPLLLPAHCVLVDALRRAGLTAEAEAAHNAALAIDGDYRLLGFCSLALEKIGHGDLDAAQELIARAEASAPDDPVIRNTRLLLRLAAGEAVDAGGPVSGPLADELAEALRSVGNRLLATSTFVPAERAFRWLLAIDPQSVPAFNALAFLLQSRGEHRARLELAEGCLAFAPWNGPAYFHSGAARMVLDKDFNTAHARIRDALRYMPGDLSVLTCDWRIRIASGRPLDVLPEVREFCAKHPQETVMRFWGLLALHAAGDVRGAFAVHEGFVGAHHDLRDHGLFALQLATLGRIGDGIAYLEGEKPGSPPADPRLRVVWAYLIGRDGRSASALDVLEATVPDLPHNALELTCWGLLLEAAGDVARADECHRRAFDIGAKWAWLNARQLFDDFARLEATYRRLGLIPDPLWPEAPQLTDADRPL